MSFQQYEKIVGETFFEANLKAESKYGKGNFEIIDTRRINHKIYFGFGHKEMVELTIGVRHNQKPESRNPEAPPRPMPSEEISLPRTVFSNINGAEKNDPQPSVRTPAPRKPVAEPVAVVSRADQPPIPVLAKAALNNYADLYKAGNSFHQAREVHGLRSNQEGNQEPHSQKLSEEPGLETDQIHELLTHIIAVKDGRNRQGRIENRPGTVAAPKPPIRESRINVPEPEPHVEPHSDSEIRMARMVEVFESKMESILAVLQKMNIDTKKELERELPDLPRGLYEVKKGLLAMETPADVAHDLVTDLRANLPGSALKNPEEAFRAASSWLEQRLRFSSEISMRNKNGPNIVVLIGPTGVGKTTTIAKLAAAYGLNYGHNSRDARSVALFTMDTFRIGATDQLQHYAQVIDVDMEVIYRPEDIDTALVAHQDKKLIIVDTAGRCQKDTDELRDLRNFIDRLPSASKYLVLSATTKYVDMLDTIRNFGKVGFEHLIFTKVDETNSIGPLLAVLFKTGKSLAYITNGQRVPDDFRPAGFDFFNDRLFGEE